MTTWGPVAIAGFVQRAGLPQSEWVTATALALAASGGRDHYHWSDPLVQWSDRWGLWALPHGHGAVDQPVRLYDPDYSANILRLLWEAGDRDWAIHESYGPNGHEVYLPLVQAVLQSKPRGSLNESDGSFADRLNRTVQRARAQANRYGDL